MLKCLLPLAAAVSLTGCATILTPHRCETALSVGHDAQSFLALIRLQFPNIEPALAQKIADGLAAGITTLEAACAAANPAANPA